MMMMMMMMMNDQSLFVPDTVSETKPSLLLRSKKMDQWHEDFEDETIPVEFLESELNEIDWLESQSTIIPEPLMVSSEEIPF